MSAPNASAKVCRAMLCSFWISLDKVNEDEAIEFMKYLEDKYHNGNPKSIYNVLPHVKNIPKKDIIEFLKYEEKKGNVKSLPGSETYMDKDNQKLYTSQNGKTIYFNKYVEDKINQYVKKIGNIYVNYINNTDNEFYIYRILTYLLFVNEKNKNSILYTPTSVINGYLISKSMKNGSSKDKNKISSPMTKTDYLAMSASVYYEKNYHRSLKKDDFIDKAYNSEIENIEEVLKNYKGREDDDDNLIYGNISNVPLYYSTNIGTVEEDHRFKTMNSAFSPISHSVHLLTTAIKSSNPNYLHKFAPIEGAPYTNENLYSNKKSEVKEIQIIYKKTEQKIETTNKIAMENFTKKRFETSFFSRFASRMYYYSLKILIEKSNEKINKKLSSLQDLEKKPKSKITEFDKKKIKEFREQIEREKNFQKEIEEDPSKRNINVLNKAAVLSFISFGDRSELSDLIINENDSWIGSAPLGYGKNINTLISTIYYGMTDPDRRDRNGGKSLTSKKEMSKIKVNEFLESQGLH